MDPTFERILDEIRPFLTEARKGKLSKGDEEFLRILADFKINLVNLQENGEGDRATLKSVCHVVLYSDYICLKNSAAVFSQRVNEVKAESEMPEILQPKIEEIEGYFAKLCELIENLDNLVKKMNNKIKDFNKRECKQLTDKERNELKFLNIDFKTGVKKTTDYFNQADRVLKMLESDVASEKKKDKEQVQQNAGFAILAATVIGGVLGGGVGALLGAVGGGFFKIANDNEHSNLCKNLETKCEKLNSKLRRLDMRRKEPNREYDGVVKKAKALQVNL